MYLECNRMSDGGVIVTARIVVVVFIIISLSSAN